ncbi:hydroxyisourate hydrolase isoform X2 [Vigna angularis]|uniref:hydroxyisourate hydrolase isoform X2 n=1 Tax=Phaseolus angularis TaxID=3914 RepID=UPI0022B42984|nr:hydroxyisourate hydrolase isoform X2 [Vigna angularis]
MWLESMETPHTCFSNAIMLTFLLLNLTLETVAGADTYNRDDFPADFVFGSGTSAYQVEGAANEEGRSDSIWDTFAHAGHGHGGNGDVACDGYHKYNEDVRLMVDTGLEAYRFSISWSRLLPNGRGPVNPKGLQYYNNLINQLITNGIQPHVSLHHYDLPQVLEDEYGGWVSRDIIRDFTDYADVCFREFGDRVLYWTTVSEPNVFSVGGYDQGTCPPQRCSPPFCFIKSNRGNSTYEPYLAIHHILLAHSSVVRLYRRKYSNKQHGFVGISIFLFGLLPQTNTEKDRAATQRVRDFLVGWVMEPLQYGDYPISMKKNAGERIPAFTTRESEQLKGSFDFIGLIHYTNVNITDNSDVLKNQLRDFGADMAANTRSDMFSNEEYPIAPWVMREELNKFKLLYGNPPIFIHENGQRTPSNSSLQDVSRVKYLHEYIGGVLDALRDGVNIKGYFSWSFMDLYELLEGYEATYGLYYVDRDDPELKRHPKLSAKWYSRLLKNRSTSIVGTVELEKDPSLVSIGHLFE